MLRHVHRQQHELPHGSSRTCFALITALPWQILLSVKPLRRSRQLILKLVEKQITPRMIVTAEAMDDAFALDMAMGGSTNTVLHGLAIANEGGIEYDLNRIKEVAEKGPLSLQGQSGWPLAY